jgi:pilus assembly protein CpaE
MTILWEPNRARAVAMLTALAQAADVRIVDNLTDAAAWVGYQDEERLVVIGAAVPFIDAVAFADYMHANYPDAVLVLVRDEVDDDLAGEAVGAGIAEVVVGEDPSALERACDRARTVLTERAALRRDETADDDDPATAAGEVVVVFSAKGGSGKTLVSTNLALTLLAGGAYSVCLVDLDLEFGDVAISLQLAPSRSIVDAVDLDLSVDGAESALVTAHTSGLHCVLAPVNPGDAERIPASLVRELLAALRTRYDYVVVDTPSQFSEHVLEAFDAAAHHVLVTTPEIPALKNTRLTLDMLDLLDYSGVARSILVNRADAKVGLSRQDIEDALRTDVMAELPATQAVPMSVNRGVPLAVGDPQHPFTLAVREFAEHAIGGSSVPVARQRRRLGLKFRKRVA